MNYCIKCVLPDTKPGVILNSSNICGACQYAEIKKNIDWEERASKLKNLCDSIRGTNGNGYECIVPVSGGKDSMFQAYMMSKVYNLKVLCINMTAHIQTVEGISNLNALVENLNLDLIKISVRPSTQQKIRRIGMFELGNPNYAEHQVVFSGVARAALTTKAPLVVWGEDIGVEFGGNVSQTSQEDGSAEDLIKNDLFNQITLEKLLKKRIPEKELFFYNHPEKSEFENNKVKSVYLSYYHKWDGHEHFKIAEKFGFMGRKKGPLSGNILNYDNIDEKLCEIHIWFKMLKFGFWRPTDQSCYQIWNNRMKRDEAVDIVLNKQYEFPDEYLNEFLEYHELKENELLDCMEKYRNLDIWHKVNNSWKLKYEVFKI